MPTPVIEVEHLSFDYAGHRALSDVSLTIEAGTVTALVGPNGAGKTTLMRCIAGLEVPLAGQIRVAGLDVAQSPRAVHRCMGFLADNFGLYDELKVAHCFEYAAAAQGLPAAKIDTAVRETAQRLGIADLLQREAGQLSRGQRQRVAIGQAIIHQPQVLLLDEPASGLDPEARSSLAVLFKALQQEGMSLLVSSHILAELDEYSSHMLALRGGTVIEHRALATDVAGSSRQRMRIELAAAGHDLAAMLSVTTGVTMHWAEPLQAEFDLEGGQMAQAELLAHLIRAGLPVASFAPLRENLQQSYLRTVAA